MSGVDRAGARELLSGPIPSIRTPFLENGDVDESGLRNVVEHYIAVGSKVLMLTAGDSHFLCLSDDEIARVTRIVIEAARGRVPVMAADRSHATGRAIAFAEFARSVGAEMVMVMPPDWAQSCTAATYAEHVVSVSRVMPVVLVTNVFIGRPIPFGLDAIGRAIDQSAQIVGIKDDVCGEFAQRMCMKYNGAVPIYAGGRKQNHLSMHAFGVDGYLSTLMVFKPDVARRYWGAIQAGDLGAARRIIMEIDQPFFDLIATCNGGFDAGMHAAMEVAGLCGRFRRSPYANATDDNVEAVRAFLARQA